MSSVRRITREEADALIRAETLEVSAIAPSATPKVSVRLITFNHAPFIAQALDGVLMQETNFPFEIVVGDDGSSDGTTEIVLDYQRRHPDRIRVLLARNNLGKYTGNGRLNFIRTLQACRGKYIAILEGDDFWTSSDKLQCQADFLDANEDCALCFHNVHLEDSTGYFKGKQSYAHRSRRLPLDREADFTIADTLPGGLIPTCSALVRNSDRISSPPLFFYHTLTADWLLWLLACEGKTMHYFHHSMAVYRVTSGGMAYALRQNWHAMYRDRVGMLIALDRYWCYRLHSTIAPSLRNYVERLPVNWTSFKMLVRYFWADPREAMKLCWKGGSQNAIKRLRLVKLRLRQATKVIKFRAARS